MFLSCGSVVRISKRLVGYGDGDGGVLSAPKPVDFSVIPWQNDQEESVLGVQVEHHMRILYFMIYLFFFENIGKLNRT